MKKQSKDQTIEMEPAPDLALKTRILKERAVRMAKPLETLVDNGVEMDGLGFLLADEQYIIDANYVVEVIRMHELTPLPCSPSFILGIINIRGRILSVINLKNFLNLPEKGITNLNRVIVVKHLNIEVGLLVDEVTSKTTVLMDRLLVAMPTLTAKQKEYLIGVTKESSVVLNIQKFLSDEKIIINEEI